MRLSERGDGWFATKLPAQYLDSHHVKYAREGFLVAAATAGQYMSMLGWREV